MGVLQVLQKSARKVFNQKRLKTRCSQLQRHDHEYHKTAAAFQSPFINQMSFLDDDDVIVLSDLFSEADNDITGMFDMESAHAVLPPPLRMMEDNWEQLVAASLLPPDFETTMEVDGTTSTILNDLMIRFFTNGNGNIQEGIQYLVTRALKQVSDTSQYNFHPHDVMQMMRLAILFKRSTQNTQELLADFLHGIVNRPAIDETVYTPLDIPTTLAELRPVLLDGKYAMVPNMPMPSGLYISPGQWYFSLFPVLGYLLGMGYVIEPLVDMPELDEVSTICESKCA